MFIDAYVSDKDTDQDIHSLSPHVSIRTHGYFRPEAEWPDKGRLSKEQSDDSETHSLPAGNSPSFPEIALTNGTTHQHPPYVPFQGIFDMLKTIAKTPVILRGLESLEDNCLKRITMCKFC